VQSGNLQPAWNLLRRFLEVNDERNVTAVIGPEPPPRPDAMQILQQVGQVAMQLAQRGDPGAGQIVQMIQTAMQNERQAQRGPDGEVLSSQALSQPLQNGGADAGSGASSVGAMDVPTIAPNPHDMIAVQMGPAGFEAAAPVAMNGV